jgi:hypothetical protein
MIRSVHGIELTPVGHAVPGCADATGTAFEAGLSNFFDHDR